VLLHAVVEIALEPAPLGVGGGDQAGPRCAQLVERLVLQRLPVPGIQGDRPPGLEPSSSCPS
jgi:hypothetical protein